MWFHAAVQDNLALLKKRGVHIIEPVTGELACDAEGKGRLPSEETILFHVRKALTAQDLKGKRILITCGGTSEALDPVRVITNKSSGRMGAALAVNALERGADVTLVHGQVTVDIPGYVRTVRAESGKAMLDSVTRLFKNSDMLIMAAAVSDFIPVSPSKSKIKKTGAGLDLKLKAVPDILKSVAGVKGKRKIIGFALEDSDLEEKKALQKLKDKNCDLLVLNTPSALGNANNRITLFRKSGPVIRCKETTKEAAAKIILDYAAAL
jgi:phosphopantothenoylcysteine decarboxylase/phosphopantothenate--cysteine ligase